MSDLSFQCVSWHAEDQHEGYTISIFGRTGNGESVCVRFTFKPFFFIEVPHHWSSGDVGCLKTSIGELLGYHQKNFIGAKLVTRKKFYGFTNNEMFKFARLEFKTHKAYKSATYKLKKAIQTHKGRVLFPMYEANIDPMLRFCHVQNIRLAGWAQVAASKCSEPEESVAFTDLEYEVENWRDVVECDNESIAPLVQASFDIETYSSDGSFPEPHDKGCPCIQIATTLQRYGEAEPYKRHLVTLGSCDDIEGVDIVRCKNEKKLLEEWAGVIRREDPDVLIGYNIWGFDLHYMYTRAELVGASQFFQLGRFQEVNSSCKAKSFSSGAYGDSDYQMVDTIGRFQLDLLVVMKREHKLTSYSLNAVSKHFLKDNKVDMPYKEMFKKFKGTSADRAEIGIYCVKDTDLPLALVNKLAILPNMVEMSKATWVPLSFLVERGQGIKVFSQILYMTRQEKMLVPMLSKDWKCKSCTKLNDERNDVCVRCKAPKEAEAAYEGATVLDAKTNAYTDTPITGLDFASLYPTIMRAHNLCHSTIVMDSKYDNIPGVEYITKDGFRFVQSPEGVLPKMLRELAQNRKTAKRAMAQAEREGNSFMQSVYNGKQLAFKVSMNSIYGFTGANVGFLPCKPVASCTTSIGREMITHTKNLVEKWYPGAEVVYGDSVTGDTPILVRYDNTGAMKYISIEMLSASQQFDGEGKMYHTVDAVSVYTETGWTKIQAIMRHRLDPDKKLYRVHTTTGVVDVTSDHSLLSAAAQMVKPSDLVEGRVLLTAFPSEAPASWQGVLSPPPLSNVVNTPSKLYAAKVFGDFRARGLEATVEVQNDRYIVSGKSTRFQWRESTLINGQVIRIEELQWKDEFVYDLTTENHHFHAGVGDLIVHNTDSVMVKFKTKEKGKAALNESFELGIEAADRISATFKNPIELEFEKVYLPYLLFSKKRYAGLMYTKPEAPDYIDAKGIQLVRRDNPPFVKKVSKEVLDTIMYKLDTATAIDIVKQAARTLLNHEVPIDDLVVSKSLKRVSYIRNPKPNELIGKKYIECNGFNIVHEYANANQPHITVARKREEREAGTGPKSGDRVPYVFVETKDPKDPQYMRAEDPDFAKSTDCKLDVLYYMDHSLQSPLVSLFSLFFNNDTRAADAALFEDARAEFKTKANRQIDIYEFLGMLSI